MVEAETYNKPWELFPHSLDEKKRSKEDPMRIQINYYHQFFLPVVLRESNWKVNYLSKVSSIPFNDLIASTIISALGESLQKFSIWTAFKVRFKWYEKTKSCWTFGGKFVYSKIGIKKEMSPFFPFHL